MRVLAVLSVIAAILIASGCGAARQPVHGAFVDPPKAPETSAATEDLIAQKAAATAAQFNAMHGAALAKSMEERDEARNEAATQAARAKALDVALADQSKAEEAGSLNRLITAGVILGALAAGIWRTGGTWLAGILGTVGGALIVLAYGTQVLNKHRDLVGWLVVFAAIGGVLWHLFVHHAALKAKQAGQDHLTASRTSVRALLEHTWLAAKHEAETLKIKAEALVNSAGRVLHLTSASKASVPAVPQPPSPAVIPAAPTA